MFGINADRVKPELRDRVIRYQLECYKVLHEAFETDDAGKITARSQDLTEASMKLGEAIYKASQDAAEAEAPEGFDETDEGPRGVDEDIVDADFEDLGKDGR